MHNRALTSIFILGSTMQVQSTCRKFQPPQPDEKSIFFANATGRLGNQLTLYSLMLQLKISLDVDAYVTDDCITNLSKFFTQESLFLKSFQATFCEHPKEIEWENYNQFIRPLLIDKSFRLGRALHLFPTLPGLSRDFNSYRSQSHECREHELLVKAGRYNMMKTLKFKPDLTQRAAQIIDHVVAQMGRPKKEITFIGVHNRRTDHLEYFERYFKKKPLKPSYFHDAMDIFRDEYDHPAFIFVSDDMEWARAKIKNKLGDVFFVGTGNPDSEVDIGTDLALLASCNATILSRGTFSIWAAILSGGEYYTEFGTIVPEHKIHPDLDFYHQDFKFK